ncbi:metalloregulator ArsR/SmtB family transcription factor [Magnetospirillum sp. UT-4]|uniref:ArsR/SmtB family transcription factor n=1 Tax=Magnetospirillum sp. UT-4 TaxID=2681467 RepID=UPI001383285D|nr:metalloregulator ArsR/SmtB family transcription factor [Magnetospirillum sp. UT-4]CAA7614379.1 Sulfurtransferase [Magnetospirillum sp. UT-4]
MSTRVSPKLSMLEQFAAVAKALSSPHRLDLLELLAQGERGVEGLAAAAGLSVANTSQHLQVLRRVGLVVSRKSGPQVLYRLSDDDVLDLLASLRRTAERHVAEVDRLVRGYFHEKDALEAVSRDDLMARMKDGLVTILDVRPPEEYAAGHLPGSVNIPVRDLERRLGELPESTEVVAYCRGPYCVLAYEAVAALRERGRRARRLEDGFPEWRAAGLPVEAAPC